MRIREATLLPNIDAETGGRQNRDLSETWSDGVKRRYEAAKWLAITIYEGREKWTDSLRQYAPPGINPRDQHNIGDAFRHYMSSAALARALEELFGGDAGKNLAMAIGDYMENHGGNPEADKVMDKNNNHAGVNAAEKSKNSMQDSINFFFDVAKGKVVVVEKDRDTGRDRARPTDINDLPHYDGDRLEDHYRPDYGDSPTKIA